MSFSESLEVIWTTTNTGVTWGQTGTYLLLDNLLLNLFGAQAFALRLPSILSSFVLVVAGMYFLRAKGMGSIYQWLLVFAFLAQESLLYYSGESRPYMPLASSAIALLAFYAMPVTKRRSFAGLTFAFWGFIWGSLMHPYWPGFLFLIILFSFWTLGAKRSSLRTRKEVSTFIALPWVTAGVLLFISLGALTWMKARGGHAPPPFEYMGSPMGAVQTLVSTHLQPLFLPDSWDILYLPTQIQWFNTSRILIILTVAVISLLAIFCRKKIPGIEFAAGLIWLAIFSSIALSALSLLQTYWILQRQWLGGMAITTVAIVWALGLVMQAWKTPCFFRIPTLISVIAIVTIFLNGLTSLVHLSGTFANSSPAWAEFELENRSKEELVEVTRRTEDWVYLGNVNIARGGPVWREVAEYYGVK